MSENNDQNFILTNKKTIIISTISIVFMLIIFMVSTYAMLISRKESNIKKLYKTGNLSVKFNENLEETNIINLNNALPTSDEIGEKMNPYTFSITGSNTDEQGNPIPNDYVSKYTVYLVSQEGSNIPLDKIKVKINDGNPFLLSRLTDNIIDNDILKQNETKNFEIRMWLDIDAGSEIENMNFSAKIVVSGQAIRYSIPTDYQQIEYIESNGTQYIDTGVIPTMKSTISVDAQITNINKELQFLFGSKHSTDSFSGTFELLKNNSNNIWEYRLGDNPYIEQNVSSDDNRHIFKLNGLELASFIDGNKISTHKDVATWLNNTYTLYLFTTNNYNSVSPYYSYAKLYSTKIWDKGILIRDFVPVVRTSDNTVGLYDMITQTFYENKGTGTFIAGPNV